ncbi:GNAT family N-acetyltransferase [Cognatilysobacter lacus]|uniref:GNAT family N-acetyltransferase n=1 Tax=Cognatilysobacter lacus TaxID=1643323 RepID=A0A5D8YRF6_9GAMM|nr:GNAT family N-acetyltransferase [Lysobacter lacus]TZF85171.1 GNAT family N-acetyltransferase [Lysobacter lacus]
MTRTSHLRVREANPGDAALLARWARTMAHETEHLELDADTVLEGVTQGIADATKARYFVAVRDMPLAGDEVIAEPVGMLMLTREWSDWRCGHWWWIQSVYVTPAHRRGGVFRALYAHVHSLARATEDVLGLRLYVERENDTAMATYTALGMRDAGYRIFEASVRGAV